MPSMPSRFLPGTSANRAAVRLHSPSIVGLRDDEVDIEELIDEQAPNDRAEPVVLPLPLSHFIAEVHLAARPAKVYETVFKRSSPFRARVYEIEGAKDVKITRWTPDPDLAAATGFPEAKTRHCSSTRRLYLALGQGVTTSARFRDKQYLLAKCSEAFAVETLSTIDAPGTWADTCSLRLQWVAELQGDSSTRMRVSINFEPNAKYSGSPGSPGAGRKDLLLESVKGTIIHHVRQRMKIWLDALVKELGASAPPIYGTTLPQSSPTASSPRPPAAGPAAAPPTSSSLEAIPRLLGAAVRLLLSPTLAAVCLLVGCLYLGAKLNQLAGALGSVAGAATQAQAQAAQNLQDQAQGAVGTGLGGTGGPDEAEVAKLVLKLLMEASKAI